MLAHFRSASGASPTGDSFLAGLWDARSAVALFFVLSGLVLHLSWAGEWPTPSAIGRFYIRRWFRIYPLYYAALIIALVVTQMLPLSECPLLRADAANAHVMAAYHRDIWQWLHHLLLISPGLDATFIVPPIWTLAEEMRVSLIFPWLSWSVARASKTTALAVIGLLFAVAPWLSAAILPAAGLLPLFAIGAWIAQHHRSVNLSRSWAIALAGLALYAAAIHLHWRLHQPAVGIGAALVMLAVLHGPGLRKALGHPLLVLGGRCSYGIYVLHFPIAMAVVWWVWSHAWPMWALYVIGIPLSMALALALHFTVELPMIRVGRKLAMRRSADDAKDGH